ncbi:MAG: rod shape-determining protein [Lachnospiraceae bacterium]|nr:rod shape-determining protein [Lachnospiraceae bacterium]
MMLHNNFGIDLGTSTIKIYDQKKNTITKEKNMIAIRDDEVFAIGNDAYEMFEKTPQNISICSPMKNGRIADVFQAEAVLHTLLNHSQSAVGYHPNLFFAVPVGMTQIEKRAYYAVAHRGKLRKCKIFLVDRPIADALALGIPIKKTKGSMIVNIGAQSTEISVIADSRVIVSKLVPIGGTQFNTAIRSNIRRKNNLHVGNKTARRLKMALADMNRGIHEGRKVVGTDCSNGLPRNGIITARTINDAIIENIRPIAREISPLLQRTPPQVHTNIQKEGIYLAGGSSRIPNMDKYLSNALECPVQLSTYYDLCTICGLKELVTHPAIWHFAYPTTR